MGKKRTLDDVNNENPQIVSSVTSEAKRSKTDKHASKSNGKLKSKDGTKKTKDKKSKRDAKSKDRGLETRLAVESTANGTINSSEPLQETATKTVHEEPSERDVDQPKDSSHIENGEVAKEKKKKKKKDKKDKASKSRTDSDLQVATEQPDEGPVEAVSSKPTKEDKKERKKKKKSQEKASEVTQAEETQEIPTTSETTAVPTENDEQEQLQTQKNHRFICFIGNLPFSATKENIAEHFKAVSPISIRAPTKKDSKTTVSRGFAFLEFDRYDRMKSCLQLYHHSKFNDGNNPPRRINVELTYDSRSLMFILFFSVLKASQC
jgi:nucleolar protein 6